MENKTLSYHNDSNLKKLVIEEMRNHQKQNQIIKGSYGFYENDGFKGCAMACAVNSINKILDKSYDTSSYEALYDVLGIPLWLSKIQDEFFECLPNEYCDKFSIDFLESIPVGVDLEPVRWKLCMDLLKEGMEIIRDKDNLTKEIKDEAIEALRDSLSLYESANKTNAWNSQLSDNYVNKMERLALKASIYLPYNVSHIINMALKSLKIDEDSMHRMFFSATIGSYDGRLSSEAIGNAYIGHSHQLLSILKDSCSNHIQCH